MKLVSVWGFNEQKIIIKSPKSQILGGGRGGCLLEERGWAERGGVCLFFESDNRSTSETVFCFVFRSDIDHISRIRKTQMAVCGFAYVFVFIVGRLLKFLV